MTRSRLFPALTALFALLGTLACVDPKPGDTSTTPLYVYDNASHQVLAWDDINTIADLAADSSAPAAARTIKGDAITNLGTLAWGGMVLNTNSNNLYLISETGGVVRVNNASNQNGTLSSTTDIATFTLGNTSSDRLASSVFSQAALDTSSGTLYVLETGSSNAWRIWVVSNPDSILSGTVAPAGTYLDSTITQDTGGAAIAATGSGNLIGFFRSGSTVPDTLGVLNGGPRLRLSSGTAFQYNTQVLVGDGTKLWDGSNTPANASLAYDTTFNRLYVARPIASGNAVLAFNQGQFTLGNMNQAPYGALPDTATALAGLRFLAHAQVKDWMAGADFTASTTGSGTGANILRIWKSPSSAAASVRYYLGTGVEIRGLALDGSK
ncbi:hypothetical protein [Mesoterricola silvestris]|uniref:Uncharacterized protein n=1 Tax=Mesoterricola silvestris TaxID=2927979 RepID=A0AA48GU50_9BACT|nr:hypothetical protein [Mesoterricola silvestris]BDU74415.1 hypothetical protein METEAL_35890 [Mesoterricola silvestris]